MSCLFFNSRSLISFILYKTDVLIPLKEKSKAFQAGVEEFHGAVISEPFVAGNSFAITWALDATFKGRGRMTIQEVCAYQVKDGKITLEQFFY